MNVLLGRFGIRLASPMEWLALRAPRAVARPEPRDLQPRRLVALRSRCR